MVKQKVEIITVAAPLNMRGNHGYRPAKLGKIEFVAERYAAMKKTLGRQGKMLVSDYEQQAFGSYGMSEHDILISREQKNNFADIQVTELANQNAEQAETIKRLQAQIAQMGASEEASTEVAPEAEKTKGKPGPKKKEGGEA